MSERRVVVTGMGAVTPIGNDVPTFWRNAVAGISGVRTISSFDVTQYSSKIAGEVKDFDPSPCFNNPKDVRRTDRYTQLAVAATREACTHAGLKDASLDMERVGVLIGSGIGGIHTLEEQSSILQARGPGRVSPFMIPMMISNMASGIVAMEYGFQGPNFAIVSACATATHSIGESWRIIRDDEADVVIAGGSEAAVSTLSLAGFAAMRAVSTRNDAPEKASRPFDRDRDGFVMGEGAGILVVEEYEHARRRGANILAEIIGYGATADAYHITSPAPEGAGGARAMQRALARARIDVSEIDYVNAHGTSTPQGDICETQGIKSVLGESAKKAWVSSTKSMIGHLLGAAGGVETIACIKTLETGVVHPTINLESPDPQCDLDYVPHTARERDVRVIMNNSFGFGGLNACLIARKLV